jgi:hypothetical protein
MAPKAPAKAQSAGQTISTAAKNIANAEKAGLLPTPRRAKAAKVQTKRGAKPKKPRPNRANTPMVGKVRKLERTTAMY